LTSTNAPSLAAKMVWILNMKIPNADGVISETYCLEHFNATCQNLAYLCTPLSY
jgi:hypothetical protein